jgi:hypothetical protein
MIKLAETAGLRLILAAALDGNIKRYDKFCSDSKLMQTLHPIGTKASASICFWYEFVKINGEVF